MSQTYVTIDSLTGIVLPILVADRGRPIRDTFLPLRQTSMSSGSTSCGDFQGKVLNQGDQSDKADQSD